MGQLIPQSDLPFTRDGVTPDILFALGNPVTKKKVGHTLLGLPRLPTPTAYPPNRTSFAGGQPDSGRV